MHCTGPEKKKPHKSRLNKKIIKKKMSCDLDTWNGNSIGTDLHRDGNIERAICDAVDAASLGSTKLDLLLGELGERQVLLALRASAVTLAPDGESSEDEAARTGGDEADGDGQHGNGGTAV